MTQRNLFRTAFLIAAIVWSGIFAFLSLRPATEAGVLPTRAVLPTMVAQVASPTLSQPSRTPTLTATATRSLPTTQPTLPATEAASSASPTEENAVNDQIVVQFAPDASAEERAEVLASLGGTVQREINALNAVVVSVEDATTTQINSPAVISSEPDHIAYALYSYSIPTNDPLLGQQWSLTPTGVMNVWNAVPETAVTVAVIDSGICASHPDLAGRVLSGWDYVDNDANPNDTYGHGCGVSSVIAANIDDDTGMAGIAPNAMILPMRVLNGSGSGSYSNVAQAIIDAADQGAKVINLSLGGTASSTLLHDAVIYATHRGAIVIAAAGNDGANRALYPAAYAEALSVGALDQNLNVASFSNYGSQINVWAPGVNIVTAHLNDGYAMQNGTSFAAPIVSGIAAMEIALGRTLDLSGDVIHIPPVEDVVQVPTSTNTPTLVPTTAPPEGRDTPGSLQLAQAPIPTDTWAVRLLPGTDPVALAAELGFVYEGAVGELPNTYLFRMAGSESGAASATASNTLASSPNVEVSQQQYLYETVKYTVPNEPGLSNQWHLYNTGQYGGTVGIDANVYPAWNTDLGGGDYVDGSGVTIAIVDDGLQYDHPGLQANYVPASSYDFQEKDNDPYPHFNIPVPSSNPTDYVDDEHGTSVAGIAAGAVDGSCGVGAAYAANLSGIRLLTSDAGVSDSMVAQSLNYAYNTNDIYNNSWGFTSLTYPTTFSLTASAIEQGALNGRNGLGNIYVWASGNYLRAYDSGYQDYVYLGYNVNNDWPANSRYTIAVGAVNNQGIQSYYSVPGAALIVSAPSSGKTIGTYTTDLLSIEGYESGNCTGGFGGTSSASPLVAGVVALMLEANPNLTWRDVQHILVETSEKVDPGNQGESSNWMTNSAGYSHSDAYGFGMIDAGAAVNAALTWENVPPEMSYTSITHAVNQPIPDGSGQHDFIIGAASAQYGAAVTDTINVPDNLIVEHVEVVFNATHPYREQLRVTLISPDGTESVLANPHYFLSYDLANYNNWRFMTVRNWGEMSAGDWTIRVDDGYQTDVGSTGTFNSWSLKVYGRIPEPTNIAAEAMAPDQIDVNWSYDGPAAVDFHVDISPDGINWTDSATVTGGQSTYSYSVPTCDRTYYFRVRAEHQTYSAYSDFTSSAQALCDPMDHLVGATDAGSVPVATSVDTTGFNDGSDPIPSCGTDPTRTAWFSFTPAQDGIYILDTVGSAINPVMSIWEDNGSLTELACDNDSGYGTAAWLSRSLLAGTTYYIEVAGVNQTSGEIALNIRKQVDPTDTPMPTDTPEPTNTPEPILSTVGLVNPEMALWSFRAANESGWAELAFHFGYAGADWVPLVGDWNGDGIDGIGLYRNGTWLLRDTTDSGSEEIVVQFGLAEPGWQPVAGDWNGDQRDGIGLYKAGRWLLRDNLTASGGYISVSFERYNGNGKPVAGDWNNDGFDTPGLFYQGSWSLRMTNQPQSAVTSFQFGDRATAWLPVVGDWNEDGFDTVGIFHAGSWYLT
ncbi:MAG: S8 family serine peptidase, partial [Anaerolineae bacterium]|nr:S8 family serine peptidase [Anaerolineae bacterium]